MARGTIRINPGIFLPLLDLPKSIELDGADSGFTIKL
jgi:hypothetical protein